MRESLNRISTFFSPEKRRAEELERAEKARAEEERNQQHREWVKTTEEKFEQLRKEGLFTHNLGGLDERFRSVNSITNGILTLEAVEKQIRQNPGQSDKDIYAWMNSVKAQVYAVESAAYAHSITPEIKREIEENLFSLYGSVDIIQIQHVLKEKYNIELSPSAFGYSSTSSGN